MAQQGQSTGEKVLVLTVSLAGLGLAAFGVYWALVALTTPRPSNG